MNFVFGLDPAVCRRARLRRARLILMLAERKILPDDPGRVAMRRDPLLCVGSSAFCRTGCSGFVRAFTPVAQWKSGTPKMEAKILEWTRRKPRERFDALEARVRLAEHLGVHQHDGGPASGNEHDFSPNGSSAYMMSDDPDFEQEKAADRHWAVCETAATCGSFSALTKKTSVQALDRLDPCNCRWRPGRAERHGFRVITVTAPSLCTPGAEHQNRRSHW